MIKIPRRLLMFCLFLFVKTTIFSQAFSPELLVASNSRDWKRVGPHTYQYLYDLPNREKETKLVATGGHPWRKDPAETVLVSTGLGLISTEGIQILNSKSMAGITEYDMNYMGSNFHTKMAVQENCYFILELAFSSSQPLYSYSNPNQSFTGVLEREIFPGPPNYQSVADGDTKEVYWILNLKNPIAVFGEDDVNVKETDIIKIQLVLNEQEYSKYVDFLGKEVVVFGELSHGSTGHHKTQVLIDTTTISLKRDK